MFVAAIVGGAGALLGYKSSKDAQKSAERQNQQQIEANALDPRIGQMLYGNDPNGNSGLLSQYMALKDRPQALGAQQFGKANENYAFNFTAPDLEAARGGAQRLLAGNTAAPMMQSTTSPTVSSPYTPATQAASINAPAQNNVNTASSFDSLINGPAGANPYLTGAIGKGINQSANAFGAMQRDSTKNLLENIMPSIRSNSVLAGQVGGSRQGIAEGKALEGFATEQQRAMSQFGQNNTDAAVAAQAGAYDADRNRQLSATMGLSGQQYGVASQEAAMRQQAAQANADRQQQTAQFNASMSQNNAQFNANNYHDTNKTNLGAQMNTNALNQQGVQAGTGLLSGLTQQAGTNASQYDQYDMTKAANVNNLLMPYLAQKPVATQLQPVYNNSTAGAISGAMGGMSLASQMGGMLGGGFSNTNFGSVPAAQTYTPSTTQPIDYTKLGAQAMNFSF